MQNITRTLLAVSLILAATSSSQGATIVDCETQRVVDEALYGADNVDSDGDQLSNQLEVDYLGTEPCMKSSDGDPHPDGVDALPQIPNPDGGAGLPAIVDILHINQVEVPSGCDDGSTWDPFIDAFGLHIDQVGLHASDLKLVGWIHPDQVTDRSNMNEDIVIKPDAEEEGQPVGDTPDYTTSGNTVTFNVNPDLHSWGSGPFPSLDLRVTLGIVDEDWVYDDTLEFPSENMAKDILATSPTTPTFTSNEAVDERGGSRDCVAEIMLSVNLDGLTDEVIDVFYKLQSNSGTGEAAMRSYSAPMRLCVDATIARLRATWAISTCRPRPSSWMVAWLASHAMIQSCGRPCGGHNLRTR